MMILEDNTNNGSIILLLTDYLYSISPIWNMCMCVRVHLCVCVCVQTHRSISFDETGVEGLLTPYQVGGAYHKALRVPCLLHRLSSLRSLLKQITKQGEGRRIKLCLLEVGHLRKWFGSLPKGDLPLLPHLPIYSHIYYIHNINILLSALIWALI